MDFACNANFKCNENAFVEKWPKYGPKLRAFVDANIATDWDGNVENLLLLLYVFPTKSNQFEKAIESLIVFRVVSSFWYFDN